MIFIFHFFCPFLMCMAGLPRQTVFTGARLQWVNCP